MKIVIHSKYKHLAAFLENLPQIFHIEGTTIYKDRNEIKVFNTAKEEIIVKSFKIPQFFNRLIYTFFRHSKAHRSYAHALILRKKQINTPQPVAYIENYKNGLLFDSYYITQYKEYPGMMRELRYQPLIVHKNLADAFARFTAHVHEQNVLPLDYSPGNILYEETDGEYHFCLVDLNRMRFLPVDRKRGSHNLRRLWGNDETITYIAKEYAKARGFDEQKTVESVLKAHAKFWKRYARRHEGFMPYIEHK
jgi:hypothetical protein